MLSVGRGELSTEGLAPGCSRQRSQPCFEAARPTW